MSSKPGETALSYHDQTKHTGYSVRSTAHFLDWDNQPIPFKIYHDLESSQLSPPEEPAGMSTLDALDPSPVPPRSTPLAPSELSRILYHAAGITKRIRRADGSEMLFRAAACTGALYHIDVYLVSEAGVFHYNPRDHTLGHLRAGDWRATLVDATGNDEHISSAEAVLVLVSTYWRNAWKYRSRAYRHGFWDGGTIVANLLASANALHVPAHVVLGFADRTVEQLIDVDPEREGVVALVSLGTDTKVLPEPPGELAPLGLQTVPLSARQVPYPAIVELHWASSLASGAEARAWRDGADIAKHPKIDRSHADYELDEPLESVIRRRGSSRRFEREPIDRKQLITILNAAIPDPMLTDLYVIANAVEGVERGTYVFENDTWRGLKKGDFRKEARFLDLEQPLAGDAAVNVYVMADLEKLVDRFGDRGYRVAQLEGGFIGGRVYLASYALGLGATGLTFYDDAVTEFFSPHADGKSVMFLVAFGVPAR